jgi:DNA-directed RNA polymerase specialized sigma subunit
MWKDILKIDRYERAVAEEFADDEDYMTAQQYRKDKRKLRSNAYQRLYQRLNRAPTKEEVEEEVKNPTRRRKRTIAHDAGYVLPATPEWKKDIQNRPENYDKIEAIVDFLKKNNKHINRQNILEELVGLPTNEDNEAIEFILGE